MRTNVFFSSNSGSQTTYSMKNVGYRIKSRNRIFVEKSNNQGTVTTFTRKYLYFKNYDITRKEENN